MHERDEKLMPSDFRHVWQLLELAIRTTSIAAVDFIPMEAIRNWPAPRFPALTALKFLSATKFELDSASIPPGARH
jgi:hypothetical protein